MGRSWGCQVGFDEGGDVGVDFVVEVQGVFDFLV